MKSILLSVVLVLAAASVGSGTTCADGTLQGYMNLGATGCTIGDKLFSNFTFTDSSLGATVPGASGIGISPLDNPNDPGLLADISILAVAGQLGDVVFGYTVSVLPGGNLIDDTSLSIVATAGGTGSVIVGQSECLGALLTTGCVGGTTASLNAELIPSLGISQIADSNTFAPVSLVDVRKDIMVAGGTTGFAAISGETQNYSETASPRVPEQATLGLLG